MAPSRPRIALFDNLANSAYIQAKMLRHLGVEADLVLDPHDRHVMSDPRWEELDIELPSADLGRAELPPVELPDWIRREPVGLARREGGYLRRRYADVLRAAPGAPWWRAGARRAGWRGARMAIEGRWIVRTLAGYDCVIAYGAGPIWAGLAGVPFVAETWGGDITMLPFYDTGDWEGHETVPLPPGSRREHHAAARMQRFGYEQASRILLTDPRFVTYAQRLGHLGKCVQIGFVIDTERYAPGPEPQLRAELLGDVPGRLIVFVPSRQDWFWKGSDRLLRGFAQAAGGRDDVLLVCAGWGADLERSRQLIAELGIGDRVRMLPHAMSKGRLRRYYRAADIVADQFTVGSYGGSALEAMSCARPLLISLDPGRFASAPAVVNVSAPDEIGTALTRLFDDPEHRARVGAQARAWVEEHHGPPLAARVLALCETVVSERRGERPTPGR
jgi:glycosyltransferase involved in cell wall biosynthesis